MRREIINQKFTIHPVGQGFFYSAVITLFDRRKFKFVFDCGTKNPKNCQDEIDLFKSAELPVGSELDLLVISHFDSDHVSHIQALLKEEVKVKRLIMPFISFEERLFLALRSIIDAGEIDDDETPEDIDARRLSEISLIVDPLGTIAENLGGAEVIMVTSGPLGSGDDDGVSDTLPNPESEITFGFDERVKGNLTEDEKKVLGIGTSLVIIKKVADNHHAKLTVGADIMDFFFYRRSIGKDEVKFYAAVKAEFWKHFDLDPSLEGDALLDAVKEKAITISSAEAVQEIFKAAKEGLVLSGDGRSITDLNTTALCMLHRNLNTIWHNTDVSPERLAHFSLDLVSKPEGNQTAIRRKRHSCCNHLFDLDDYDYFWENTWTELTRKRFPNVLLTSDSFIRDPKEVVKFYKKYKPYWSDFWLFQIPHHGADNNANKNLLARLDGRQHTFINYGINNGHKHPNDRLILDMVSCGLSENYFPVNEYKGVEFNYTLVQL